MIKIEPAREVMWMRPLLLVCASWVLGNIARTLRPVMSAGGVHYEALVSMIILFATALALVAYHRRERPGHGQRFYHLELLALWTGFTSGWSIVHGDAWDDLIGVTVTSWLVCAILGGSLLVMFQRLAKREP